MNAVFKSEYANLVQIAVSTEETRYYLNGFLVERERSGALRIVSTDGQRMLVFRDANGTAAEGTRLIVKLPPDFLKQCDKPGWERRNKDARYVEIDSDARTATLWERDPRDPESRANKLTIAFDVLIDESFLDYERLIPRFDPTTPAANPAFNARYIADFAKLFPRLHIVNNDISGPALVYFGRDDGFGVLMPLRASGSSTLPDWFAAP